MTYIIAEVGGNHDGNLDEAFRLVEAAALAGADAIKFQTYHAERLVHPDTPALPQAKGYTRQIDRFRDLEFTDDEWMQIIFACQNWNIDFLTTCFDIPTLEMYAPFMPYIKIASGDLTYDRLLRSAAEIGKPILLSTGMADYDEIEHALGVLQGSKVALFHCVSSYPCPLSHANMLTIDQFQAMKVEVGYSDHTEGLLACQIAIAKGVSFIEKHFTLDPSRDYGDHNLSADPIALKMLVDFKNAIEMACGNKKPASIELENRKAMRRGAYAAKDIPFGHVISENDIAALRPETTIKPHEAVGLRATRAYKKGEAIDN